MCEIEGQDFWHVACNKISALSKVGLVRVVSEQEAGLVHFTREGYSCCLSSGYPHEGEQR